MINRGTRHGLTRNQSSAGLASTLHGYLELQRVSGSLRDWDEAEPVLRELWAELGDDLDWPHARQAMYMIWKRAKH